MKLTLNLYLNLYTAKGHYGKKITIRGNNLKQCLDKIIPELKKMPEELEGAKQIDWTDIYIGIQR